MLRGNAVNTERSLIPLMHRGVRLWHPRKPLTLGHVTMLRLCTLPMQPSKANA